jgi:4-amino-4-deoxy-L-arabinose transferase-like glycosyltransferase
VRLSRLWLAIVLIAFCLPLFVGLGDADLETDEAIYSFAVDRILETGDWLAPRSSPSETAVFLEKPPLKFWLVALPIKAGVLPHDERGLRFADALLGSLAFLYVFALGSLLAGPVCGAVAVLLLFVHEPLLFTHGLRSNNMEASLVLCYCGGVFHFLRWSAAASGSGRTPLVAQPPGAGVNRAARHAIAATLYLVLGFMTKFVAALFLPFTLGLAAIAAPRVRARLAGDWRTWAWCVVLFVALCAPWFVYAQIRFGWLLWDTILAEHVLRRMTTYLDPTHVQPWHYYITTMWQELAIDRVEWLAAAGLIVLFVQTVRRRWFEGAVILLWLAVPLAIISAGSSKLYHYVYPFLPPVMLAAGYLVALVAMLAPAPLRRALEWIEDRAGRAVPAVQRHVAGAVPRSVASAVVLFASAVTIATIVLGAVRLRVNGSTLLRSSDIVRPLAAIVVAAVLTRTGARVARVIVVLLILSVMPVRAYRAELSDLQAGKHPIRTAAACLARVQAQHAPAAGILMDVPEGIWHPLYYYFRRIQPVSRASSPLDPAIDRYLTDPESARPVLIGDPTWREYVETRKKAGAPESQTSPPMVSFLNTTLLLPGPYAACSSEAVLRTPR